MAVAFSGGTDSTALLVATLRQAQPLGLPVVALHVHHGLMPEADAWATQARQVCKRLGVPFRLKRLRGAPAPGDSVEAWARKHRYVALAGLAKRAGASLVLLAHHAEDQAETVLLQALRGGGPAGLSAMPAQWQADGLHWARPWLHQPRAKLAALVLEAGLPFAQDPSNADPRFARSRLRSQVWPVLVEAFPHAAGVLGEVARHAAHARQLADEIAQLDLPTCCDESGRLRHQDWSRLPPARRRNAMAAWLQQQLPQGVPVALLDRLNSEWTGLGRRWPTPAGWVRSVRGSLSIEDSPAAK